VGGFEPFFTTKSPAEGTGLGLAQVHGIVMQHEGHIDIHSQVGRGTTFVIYLPALQIYQPELPAMNLPDLVGGRGETILVVEDSEPTRQALVASLEELNYGTLEAVNGREALDILEQRGDEIGLVLSDVVMPGMGGIALLRSMKAQGYRIGVVLLTGHPLERELEDLQFQEPDSPLIGWLLKPAGLEQLADIVAQGIEAFR